MPYRPCWAALGPLLLKGTVQGPSKPTNKWSEEIDRRLSPARCTDQRSMPTITRHLLGVVRHYVISYHRLSTPSKSNWGMFWTLIPTRRRYRWRSIRGTGRAGILGTAIGAIGVLPSHTPRTIESAMLPMRRKRSALLRPCTT